MDNNSKFLDYDFEYFTNSTKESTSSTKKDEYNVVQKSIKTYKLDKTRLMYCTELIMLLNSITDDVIPNINSIILKDNELKVEEQKIIRNLDNYVKRNRRDRVIDIFKRIIRNIEVFDYVGIIDEISLTGSNILLGNKGKVYIDDYYKYFIKNEDNIYMYDELNVIEKVKELFDSMKKSENNSENKKFNKVIQNIPNSTTIEELNLILEDEEDSSYMKRKVKFFEEFYFNRIYDLSKHMRKSIDAAKKLKKRTLDIEFFCFVDVEYFYSQSMCFKNLTHLKLNFNNYIFDTKRQSCQILSRCLEYFNKLTDLYLYKINGECMKVISPNLYFIPNLKRLCLSGSEIEDSGMISLSKHLEYISNLEELDVSCCNIKRRGIKSFCENTWKIPSLKKLDLTSNKVDEDLADLMSESFADLKSLKKVRMRGMNFKHPIIFKKNVQSGCFKVLV